MKRYDKVTRYSIKKYSVGVASVAVAAFVFFAGGEAQAADKNAETPAATAVENATSTAEETSTPTEESVTTGSSATDKKETLETTTAVNEIPENSSSTTETSATENKETTSVPDTSVAESESASAADATATESASAADATATESAEGEITEKEEAEATNEEKVAEEAPTMANIDEDTKSNLIKGKTFNGEYGVNLSFKGKDGKEYTTTYGGTSFINLEKIDTTSPITATFTLKNDESQAINAAIILTIPNYSRGNSSLVFDGSNLDKNKGITITSSSGTDYSSLLTYSRKGGEYLNLQQYISKYGEEAFDEKLKAIYLQRGQIKANDTVSYSLNFKLKEQDVRNTPAQSTLFQIMDFINGHNGYATDNLNVTFIHNEDINTGILLDKQVIPAYHPSNGEDGGTLWEYAADIQQYMPTPDEMFRFASLDNNILPEESLYFEKNEDGYYIVASGDERLKGFPNLSPYTYLLVTQTQKNISTHGYTANPASLKDGFYRYRIESSDNFVLNGINLDDEKEIGAKILHFQVIPSIILKGNQTYTVGESAEKEWNPSTMVKQFTDPNIVKWAVAEDDSNQLDKSKLSVKITDITNSAEPKDVSSISLEKAGKYKVEYSYVFKDSSGADLPISNTGYVTVLTGKQKLIVNVVDKNDPSKEVILATDTIEGASGEAIDTASLNAKKEQLVADYIAKGYKFVSNTALPTKFDSTENFVDDVDEVPQVVEIALVHDTENQDETKDATLTIKYEGAGGFTPDTKVITKQKAFSRTNVFDKVDKKVVKEGTWAPESVTFDEVVTPIIKGYTPDKTNVKDEKATLENLNPSVTVTYKKDANILTTENKDVLRTIIITLPDGTTNKVEQKVTFTRTNTQDPVTDVVTNGEWNVEKQTLPAYVPTNYTGFTTKVDGDVGEVEVTPDTADLTTTISYVNTPLVKNEEIPFETKYVEDETLDFGKTTETPGVAGKKEITTSYKFENGNSVAQDSTEEVVVAPVDRVIKVGTKPKVETSEVAYKIVYEADDTLEFGQTKVKIEGVNGVDTTTTTYKLAGDHAVENEATTVRTTEPTNKVILVGTKPSVTAKELNYKTIYKENTSLEAGKRNVLVEGKKGSEVTTTTYEVNTTTGEVTSSIDNKTTAAVDKVIEVGTKAKVTTETKEVPLRYEADNTLEKGQQVVEKEGKAGQKVTTITYTLNTQTGEVSENTNVVETNSEERVIKVGTQPTSVITNQDYNTKYEADNILAYGQRKVKQLGEKGVTTVVTTYTVDEKTGQLTSHEQDPQVYAPQDEIILVGTQPKVETAEVAYKILYEADNTLDFGQRKVKTEGAKGVDTTTTTYKLEGNHAVVDKTTTVRTTEPTDEVILVGTQPSVAVKELAYKTIYKNSKDLELGETKVEKHGVKGLEKTTTTYTLNTTTGEVTQSVKVETSEPVDEIVLVGTKVKEEKHTYSYNFVSTTEENLPKEVLDLTPKGGEYDATVVLVPELPTKLEVETEKGTWKFVGYTPSEVLEFEDVVFVGEWNFVKKAEPITPPRPNKPEKPVTPPQPQKPEKHEDPIIPQPNEQDKKPQKPSEPQNPQNPQEQKQETPQKENEETSTQKEVKKLPNTTATNNTLGASALMLTVLAALGLKRRKDNK